MAGSVWTTEQAQEQAAELKKQIEATWKGTYKEGEYTYSVSSEITAKVMGESQAVAEGQAGRIDNVVTLTSGNKVIDVGSGKDFGAYTIHLSNERFNRLTIPVNLQGHYGPLIGDYGYPGRPMDDV